MEGNLQRSVCHHSVIQRYRSNAASGITQSMKSVRALLCVALVALVCSGLPAQRSSTSNNINSIITIAQITLLHIKKLRTKLPVAVQIDTVTPSIEGLTGIIQDLGLLDNELQSPVTDLLVQIQADVSSLEGRVRALAVSLDCPVQARPNRSASDPHVFPDSRLHLTLTKVQLYLEKFILHRDQLEVC